MWRRQVKCSARGNNGALGALKGGRGTGQGSGCWEGWVMEGSGFRSSDAIGALKGGRGMGQVVGRVGDRGFRVQGQ